MAREEMKDFEYEDAHGWVRALVPLLRMVVQSRWQGEGIDPRNDSKSQSSHCIGVETEE